MLWLVQSYSQFGKIPQSMHSDCTSVSFWARIHRGRTTAFGSWLSSMCWLTDSGWDFSDMSNFTYYLETVVLHAITGLHLWNESGFIRNLQAEQNLFCMFWNSWKCSYLEQFYPLPPTMCRACVKEENINIAVRLTLQLKCLIWGESSTVASQ